MIIIGTLVDAWSKLIAQQAQTALNAHTETQFAYFSNEMELMDALLNGTVQVYPKIFTEIKTQLPAGIAISALSPREQCAYSLLISDDAFDADILLNIKNAARVWVSYPLQKVQLNSFREDLQIEQLRATPYEALQFFEDKIYDAVLLDSFSINVLNIDLNKYKTFTFNPKEFTTEAGQGIIGYLTAQDDLPTRRVLKNIHNSEIVPAINIERSLKGLFNNRGVAAYCYKDTMNNYHLYSTALVEGVLRQAKISQTTSFEMAERCREMLL